MRTRLSGILREGLFGGFAAYIAVVLALAVLNAVQGRSIFHTAAAMGSVLLYGGEAEAAFALDPAPILAYNGIHLLGSIVVASLAAFMVFETEAHRSLYYVGLMLLVAVAFFGIAWFGIVGVEIGGLLDWTTVVVATLVWLGAMTAYFLWQHPALFKGVRGPTAA